MASSSKTLLPLLAAVAIAVLAVTIGPFLSPPVDSEAIAMSDETVYIDGLSFSSEIKIAGSKQLLVGGGTRSKWGFKVYAVGIYGEKKLVKGLKKKYVGDVAGPNLARDFSGSKQARTLLLRFHRGVATKDVSEALGEALVDKVGKKTSAEFQTFILDMVSKQGKEGFQKGSDMYITCKGEKLWASLKGTDASTISIKGLCSAIFTVYLGDSPVSPQAKEGFEKGFASMDLDK